MRYFISDIHGNFELFKELLKKICFSESDEMYICGDVIDKGKNPIKLLKYIFSQPNMHLIMGNHEYEFLKVYHAMMRLSEGDYDLVPERLGEYIFDDDECLDWETLDRLDALPCYIEGDDFICTHAGVPLDDDGKIPDLSIVEDESLLYGRCFKGVNVKNTSQKCVFFGHTPTNFMYGDPKIYVHFREGAKPPYTISKLHKVHLDTGVWTTGVLGCFCADNCKAYYVKK